ncbi:MAG: hypothetical protein IJZ79_06755 [Bacilli bacterium]|nr:hypothetical protein [Bacilli bacterium]
MTKKLKKFFYKEYKILIPIMVIFVLLITLFFLYKEYKYDNYRNKQEEEVYQYFGGVRNDYTSIVTYNLKDIIIDVSPKDKKIDYDSTPIYFKDTKKVLFPKEMLVAFPLQEGSQYKLYQYSIYENDDSIHRIKNRTYEGYYDYFFLYDGEELFFFPDKVDLKIDGVLYKELSPMSYVSLVGGYTLIYYDYDSDTSEVIEVEGKNISISSEYINISISDRYFKYFDHKIYLSKPEILREIYKNN